MIRVEALTRTYGGLTAVDRVSFDIGKGEIVGLRLTVWISIQRAKKFSSRLATCLKTTLFTTK